MKKIIFRSVLIIILLFLGIRYFTSDASSDNQTFGVTLEGKVIDVIDMHMHTGTWEALTEPYKKRYSERVPKPFKFVIKYSV